MKQTFTLELETSGDNERFFDVEAIEAFIKHSLDFFLGPKSMIETKVSVVEQNCGTPENTSENSKKPLRLSGNIVWENQIDFGDDYLDDRMNSLIDR